MLKLLVSVGALAITFSFCGIIVSGSPVASELTFGGLALACALSVVGAFAYLCVAGFRYASAHALTRTQS